MSDEGLEAYFDRVSVIAHLWRVSAESDVNGIRGVNRPASLGEGRSSGVETARFHHSPVPEEPRTPYVTVYVITRGEHAGDGMSPVGRIVALRSCRVHDVVRDAISGKNKQIFHQIKIQKMSGRLEMV